jgi:ribosomal protein S18 acetylase RimI-like enzyme
VRITTRAASLEDLDFLVGLLGDWHRPDALDQIEGRIEHSITYVVCVDGRSVGRLRLVRTEHHIEIAGIQVDPAHQDRGIGTTVIRKVLDEARGTGRPVELNVHKNNPDAERLYTRLGFRRLRQVGDEYRMTTATDTGQR